MILGIPQYKLFKKLLLIDPNYQIKDKLGTQLIFEITSFEQKLQKGFLFFKWVTEPLNFTVIVNLKYTYHDPNWIINYHLGTLFGNLKIVGGILASESKFIISLSHATSQIFL